MIGFLLRWVLLILLAFVIVRASNAWFVDTLGGEFLGVVVIALGAASVRSVLHKLNRLNAPMLAAGSAGVVLALGVGAVTLLPNWEVNSVGRISLAYVLGVLTAIGINNWIEDR